MEKKRSTQTERLPTTLATWNHCIEPGIHLSSINYSIPVPPSLSKNNAHFIKFGNSFATFTKAIVGRNTQQFESIISYNFIFKTYFNIIPQSSATSPSWPLLFMFQVKILYAFLYPYTSYAFFSSFDNMGYQLWKSELCQFLYASVTPSLLGSYFFFLWTQAMSSHTKCP